MLPGNTLHPFGCSIFIFHHLSLTKITSVRACVVHVCVCGACVVHVCVSARVYVCFPHCFSYFTWVENLSVLNYLRSFCQLRILVDRFTGHVSKSWQQFPIVTHLLLLATWHLLHKLDISHASVVTNQITLKVRLTWGTAETKSELSSKYATQSRPLSVAHTQVRFSKSNVYII